MLGIIREGIGNTTGNTIRERGQRRICNPEHVCSATPVFQVLVLAKVLFPIEKIKLMPQGRAGTSSQSLPSLAFFHLHLRVHFFEGGGLGGTFEIIFVVCRFVAVSVIRGYTSCGRFLDKYGNSQS